MMKCRLSNEDQNWKPGFHPCGPGSFPVAEDSPDQNNGDTDKGAFFHTVQQTVSPSATRPRPVGQHVCAKRAAGFTVAEHGKPVHAVSVCFVTDL